jgi:D-amino-acid dehydrogenase
MGSRLRLAGTVEFSGLNRRLVQERVDMLTRGAGWYLKGLKGAETLGQGCDLRPCTADGLPVLGWAPGLEGLMISTGGAKMGVTLAPALGKMAAELILEGRASLNVAALGPNRF